MKVMETSWNSVSMFLCQPCSAGTQVEARAFESYLQTVPAPCATVAVFTPFRPLTVYNQLKRVPVRLRTSGRIAYVRHSLFERHPGQLESVALGWRLGSLHRALCVRRVVPGDAVSRPPGVHAAVEVHVISRVHRPRGGDFHQKARPPYRIARAAE